MAHGTFIYPSKGKCIYCGDSSNKLTDEHILPLSLGGTQILAKASCLRCADITKKFEFEVARNLWGDARNSYNAPSRRRKLRPTHFEFPDQRTPGKKLKVPYSEYPAPMVFYKMNKAGILEGVPSTVDLSVLWEFSVITDDAKAKAFKEKFGHPLPARFKHVPDSFARLIAKVGYCQILCSFDRDDFRPFCLPYILGQKTNLSYLVGGSLEIGGPIPNIGYNLSTMCFGDKDRLILMALIRLYANNHTPSYHVVVGDVIGEASVSAAIEKLGEGKYHDLPPGHVIGNKSTTLDHWMTKAWPLPIDI